MEFKSHSSQTAPRETFDTIPKGWYDFTVTHIESKRSKKGDPQMVWTITTDNGEHAGSDLKIYFTFKDDSNIAWAQLANICDAAGIEFEEANSLEAFAAQFPLNKIRFSAEIDHRYSIKAYIDKDNPYAYSKFTELKTEDTPYFHQINVQEKEFEEYEGEKSGPWPQIRDGLDFGNIFNKPKGKRELQLDESEKELAEAEAVIAGEDDDLPF